jgi:putative protease
MAKVELLSPAGSMLKLKTAFHYGADAVYLGGKTFNLRAQSSNFSKAALKEAVEYAHGLGKKVYCALNIIAHNREIKALPSFLKYLEEVGIDAVIVADLGVLELVQEVSNIPIHISTQSSSTNWRSVKMWRKLGVKRVVLAREVSIDDMKRIKDEVPDMELEVFVHGSMCMTYSGRCQLSSYFAERDGNRGVCANTCRWKFALVEEKRPGEYFPVYEDDQGSHIYNSKDLCTIEFLDKIIDAGVDGLKIEGRMKSLMYAATTAKIYRQGIDSYFSEGGFRYDPQWRTELETFTHRGYTSGFYLGQLDKYSEARRGGYTATHKIVGNIEDILPDQGYVLNVLNKLAKGSVVEVIQPKETNTQAVVAGMYRLDNGKELDLAQPNDKIRIHFLEGDAKPFDIIRQISASSNDSQYP